MGYIPCLAQPVSHIFERYVYVGIYTMFHTAYILHFVRVWICRILIFERGKGVKMRSFRWEPSGC